MQQKHDAVLLIDADTNMHSWTYFGITYDESKMISQSGNSYTIKQLLINDNKRIVSPAHMVKTTPPGTGSYILVETHDSILQPYNQSTEYNLSLLAVWWYTSIHAWTTCYHTDLAIVENILSHMELRPHNHCVVDMVASTDAFSNSFHVQFDLIVLITEPTRESIALVKNYLALATETGIQDKILIIWNKIEWDDDVDYIKQNMQQPVSSYLVYDSSLKAYMRTAQSIHRYVKEHESFLEEIFGPIVARKPLERATQLRKLAELHKKYAQQSYIINELWDLSSQIDEAFIESH